jgi:hypothetical protein
MRPAAPIAAAPIPLTADGKATGNADALGANIAPNAEALVPKSVRRTPSNASERAATERRRKRFFIFVVDISCNGSQ